MDIFVVMRTVDLGGNPEVAFTDSSKAVKHANDLISKHKKQKIKDLVLTGRYTIESATQYVEYYNCEFYVEKVELKEY